MNFDNSLKIAFIISVLCHSFIFFVFPVFNIFSQKDQTKTFEVSYYQFKEYQAVSTSHRVKIKKSVEQISSRIEDAKKKEIEIPIPKKEQIVKAPSPQSTEAKKDIDSSTDTKNANVIMPRASTLEKMPGYLKYAQSVRNKIKQIAYSKYNYPYPKGKIFLNFTLSSDGGLAVVQLDYQRSYDNEGLKRIAKDAIEEAAPFEPFPADIEFKQLSFSLVISFE